METRLLVADEVAEMLRVDRQRIYELVRTRKIPVIRLGERQYRFSADAVRQWLENGGSVTGGVCESSRNTGEIERS
jgi:excisionase family DNA binding protein